MCRRLSGDSNYECTEFQLCDTGGYSNALFVAVTLSASDDWNDHIKMHEYGFSKAAGVPLDGDLSGVALKVVGSEKTAVSLKLAQAPTAVFTGEVPPVERVISLRAFEYAPVNEGDVVGTVRYYANGELICESAIAAGESAEVYVPPQPEEPVEVQGFFTRLFNKVKNFVLRLR